MKWGVVRCAPGDAHVVEKAICFNELGALRRGRDWKRRHPDDLVRTISLLPGDTSPAEEVTLVSRRPSP